MINNFKIWETIKVGTYKNADELYKAVLELTRHENEMMKSIFRIQGESIIDLEKEINLINVSVEELGFLNGAIYGDILVKAKELGLELCPLEVGPHLYLQYRDQPEGDELRIAMEPVWYFFNPSAGCGWVTFTVAGFCVPGWVCYGVYCSSRCRDDDFIEANVRFVFVGKG